MAVGKNFAPVVLVDAVIREIDLWVTRPRTAENVPTGEEIVKGRKLTLLTSRGFAEMRVTTDDDHVIFSEDDRIVVFADVSEFPADNGASYTALRYRQHVSPDYLKGLAVEVAKLVPGKAA